MKPHISFLAAIDEVYKKPQDIWKTASGWGGKNIKGEVEYFDKEDHAKAWVNGTAKMRAHGSVDPVKGRDISRAMNIDQYGNDADAVAL